MEPAVDPFREALKMMRLSAPRIPVYSNVKNQIYTKPDQVKYLLMLIDFISQVNHVIFYGVISSNSLKLAQDPY